LHLPLGIFMASYALLGIALLTLLFLVILVFHDLHERTWQFIVLLSFAGVCVALPLLIKINFSKDGGSIEVTSPLDLIDKMEAKAQAARIESIEQTRKQIGALSVQISDLLATLANDSGALGTSILIEGTQETRETPEPTLHDIRTSLPSPTVLDDPQRVDLAEKNPMVRGSCWLRFCHPT
jgi:hypothetical protein